jgi:phosphoglycolate phosphatase-like HAD superfamily hydrolase
LSNYLTWEVEGLDCYVKKDCLSKLKFVDAIVFDCDGVLIDIRKSYNKAAIGVVNYILKLVTGIDFPIEMVSKETIHLFKKSGGFNNDWDMVYAILLYSIICLPDEIQDVIIKFVNSKKSINYSWKEKFLVLQTQINERIEDIDIEEVSSRIKDDIGKFAKTVDEEGIISIERKLSPFFPKHNVEEITTSIKLLFNYPGNVYESPISSIFEEIFSGPKLFKTIYRKKAQFFSDTGFIDEERNIITEITLERLATLINGNNFGIASGRTYSSAKYTLGNILSMFKRDSLIFFEKVEEYERKYSHEKLNLKKPKPFSLLKAAESLEPFTYALYVGDSIEDFIMVNKANEEDNRFLSVGVYYFSDLKEMVIDDFFEVKVDIILPSVNELNILLEKFKE